MISRSEHVTERESIFSYSFSLLRVIAAIESSIFLSRVSDASLQHHCVENCGKKKHEENIVVTELRLGRANFRDRGLLSSAFAHRSSPATCVRRENIAPAGSDCAPQWRAILEAFNEKRNNPSALASSVFPISASTSGAAHTRHATYFLKRRNCFSTLAQS